MRHLAIDFGTRRLGLALSDAGGRLATPLQVLEVSDPAEAIGPIAALAAAEDVKAIVLGIPLNMDGSVGPTARKVKQWSVELAARTGCRLVFVDERLSSFEAEQTLRARKQSGERLTRRGRKQRLDALAAAQLLQAYLDGRLKSLQAEI